jgi:hypothetical protein
MCPSAARTQAPASSRAAPTSPAIKRSNGNRTGSPAARFLTLSRPPSARRFGRLIAVVGLLVALDDVVGETAVGGYRQALMLCPQTDPSTAFAAGGCPGSSPLTVRTGQPGMVEIRRQLVAELIGMLGAEVNLVVPAFVAEVDRLVGWAACQVIFKSDIDPLHGSPFEVRITLAASRSPIRGMAYSHCWMALPP